MRGFKDYHKLTMVGVRFGVDHCSFGIHSVIKSRKDRVRTSVGVILCGSGDQTARLAV